MKPFLTSFLLITSSTQGVGTTLSAPSLPTPPWQQGEGGRGRRRRTGERSGRTHQANPTQLLPGFLIAG